ncbi:hypothetical protein RH915_10315 [Serpentinicella sp. ANB-PHB4]|uniref:hypothetical protein n=1 Tax=Serpentinicella sp. ANB-PHB4 TaxID=3074076 RepID=UPI00285CE35D|nr:hypothetical protein [Serpentinicella sp. ANB-PHB4]MDR5659882.1 hypothetical protein [Serpentinicella sp. ANB-PHB4]
MNIKKSLFILIIISILALTACGSSTSVYTGEHISLNYSDDWEIKNDDSKYTNQIILENESDLKVIIDVEVIGDKNDEEIRAQIEKDLNEGYKLAQKMLSMEVVSFDDITIDGEEAKALTQNVQLIDNAIEQLYYFLTEDMNLDNEDNNYLSEYEADGFIRKIKNDPSKLEELKSLLSNTESHEETRVMIAKGLIDNANHYLSEKDDKIIRQTMIVAVKDGISVNIYFESTETDYEENAENVQKIVDSITI